MAVGALLLPAVEGVHCACVFDDGFPEAAVATLCHAAVSDDAGDGLVVAVPDVGVAVAQHRKIAVLPQEGVQTPSVKRISVS
mgnify:CR=1 FL=1